MSEKFKFWAVKLAIVCIIFYVLQKIFVGFTDLLLLSNQHPLQIWRYLTAIFLHAGLGHLILNMFALILFGSILEKIVGWRKFLIVFIGTGVLANLISINFYASSLGASGAIFGVIGALIVVRPLMTVWAFGLPLPIFVAGILWALADILGTALPSDIANIAHLSGLVIGLISGMLLRDWNEKMQKPQSVRLDEGFMRRWEDNYM